ncbi:DUF4276 family protein [Ralstonia solanacearum]|uniref:DUF4276 family protein n=1 Tax=Ralstonia solanacearum TaxID=305 RepID=UPI0009BAF75F|nr:DUF4276 family protein [Ralstonia solanacearum]
MSVKIGIIAEDVSDVEVLKLLARKITGKPVSTAHFTGKGCGPLKKKTPGWCKDLAHKGCTKILLVHDLDRNDAKTLRKTLEGILQKSTAFKQAVVIPAEELEAWLLSDTSAITSALNLQKALKVVHHPETISSPKEYIRDKVWQVSNKTTAYVNSVHNKLIAEKLNIKFVQKKCPSFKDFANFFVS